MGSQASASRRMRQWGLDCCMPTVQQRRCCCGIFELFSRKMLLSLRTGCYTSVPRSATHN
eukprot:3945938-Pleurochrysis_carterae.AAC.1